MSRGRAILKLLRRFVLSLAVLLLGLVSLVLILLAVIGVAPNTIKGPLNGMLEGMFEGTLVVGDIGSVSPNGADDVDLVLKDPSGRQIGRAFDASVRLSWVDLVGELVRPGETMHIVIDKLEVDAVHLDLGAGPSGDLLLGQAFQSPQPSTGTSPPVVFELSEGHVESAWIYIRDTDAPLDVQLDSVQAGVRFEESTLELDGVSAVASVRRPDIPFQKIRLEGNSRLRFLETEDGASDPLAGLVSETALVLTSDGARLEVDAENDRRQFEVTARAEIPPSLGSRVGLHFDTAATVDVRAHGTLEDFQTTVVARHQRSEVEAELRLRQPGRLRLTGTLTARKVSPDLFAVDGLSPIDATVNFEVVRDSEPAYEIDRLTARASGSVESFRAQERKLPPLSFEADLADRVAEVKVRARGADRDRVTLVARFDRNFGLKSARVFGSLSAERLLSTLQVPAQGSGTIRFDVALSPDDSSVDGTVSGQLTDLRPSAEIRAESVDFEGSIEGRLEHPRIDFELDGEGGALLGQEFESFEATFEGTPSGGRIRAELASGPARTTVEARVSLTGGDLGVDEVSLQTTGGKSPFGVTVDELSVKNGRVEFTSARISGVGTSNLSGSWGPRGLELTGFVRDVRLDRLSEVLPIDLPVSGIVDLDVDVLVGDRNVDGRVRAVVSEMRATDPLVSPALPPAEVHLDVVGTGRELAAWVESEWDSERRERATSAALQVQMRTPRLAAFTDPGVLLDRVEDVEVHFDVELAPLSPLLPQMEFQRGRASGTIQLTRAFAGAEPDALVEVHGSGIHLVLHRATTAEASVAEALATESSAEGGPAQDSRAETAIALDDMGLVLRLDSAPAERRLDVAVRLDRNDRELVAAQVSVKRRLSEVVELAASSSWRSLPLDAEVIVPRRALEDFPPALRPSGLEGSVSAVGRFEGTLESPNASIRLDVEDLRPTEATDDSDTALSGFVEGSYEPGVLSWNARLRGDASKLGSRGELHVAFNGQGDALFQRLDGELLLKRFDLASIPQLSTAQVAGPIDAEVRLVGWGTEDETLSVDANLDDVVVRDIPLSGAKLEARLVDDVVEGSIEMQGSDFRLQAEGRTEILREGFFGVSLGDQQRGTASAQNFPIQVLQPVVGRQVAGLRGRLDLALEARRTPTGPAIVATADLEDAALQIPSAGQRLRDIEAHMSWTEEGALRIENASFRGTSGRGTFDAEVQMDGLLPRSGSLGISVDSEERLPLSLAGFGTGEAWGDITTTFELDYDEQKLTTDTRVDEFQLWLAQVPTGQVQSLAPAEAVTVGTRVPSQNFVEIPLQPVEDQAGEASVWTIRSTFDLGDEFWLAQGTRRRVQLAGDVSIVAGAELRTSGTIRIPRGEFELNGRTFRIHRGTITLQPDEPENPIIIVEAHWESPEGILVIAKFTGPAESGEITLTSDPPMRNDQVVSLLLFGDPSGLGQGPADGESTNQAAVVGGSVATQGINNALRRYEGIDLSTRVRGTDNNVRPELVVQLTNSLSAQLGYNLEEPVPGKSPDRTLITFELRLVGGSSLSLTAGDRGTTVFDWLWRYRY